MFVARSLRTNETHDLNSIEELIQDLEVLNIKNKKLKNQKQSLFMKQIPMEKLSMNLK